MKFYESHFEEYIVSNQKINLHPKLESVFLKNFPESIQQLKNVIFYGPSGVGKYTQVLRSIKKYSPSELKYEKKLSIVFNKQVYYFKISDIHYEIDMSILGCNSKLLWHDIYQQIIDIISAKPEKNGIIVCKNFHDIHSELLDNFYSYMQNNLMTSFNITFFIISEHISFLPDNIIKCCEIIHIPRPSASTYNKCIQTTPKRKKMPLSEITNIKNLHSDELVMDHYKIITDKILHVILHVEEEFKIVVFRDLLYDMLIYNLDINQCVWYIVTTLVLSNKIPQKNVSDVLMNLYKFFKYYNNNYRPIYHLEYFFTYIIQVVYGFEQKTNTSITSI
jgi:Cdc6-like AAA superfamily ATPase